MSGLAPEFKVEGLADLVATLRTAPDKLQQRVMVGAVAEGARVITDEAVIRAPYWSGRIAAKHPPAGTLKKAIYQYRIRGEADNVVAWMVSVKRGKKGNPDSPDAYYATWVEYGHLTRGKVARSRAEGRAIMAGTVQADTGVNFVLPRPYMRPAFEAKKGEAVLAIRDYIAKNLPKIVAR